MRRFFVPPENIQEGRLEIAGPDVNHIRNVLRMGEGDEILALDGKGNQYRVRLREFHHNRILGEVLDRDDCRTESPVDIWMGQALIKGHRFDKLLRKAVELGVYDIVPLVTERSIPRWSSSQEAGKIERWRQVATEACKQCGRARVPDFSMGIRSLEEFLEFAGSLDLVLGFWESESETRLKDLDVAAPRSIGFLTGPEGGWAPAEIDLMRRHGVRTVSLGPRILRAESASLVILSLLQHRWGDL